jgi:uncharacterized phage protein (TIGR01671 family)
MSYEPCFADRVTITYEAMDDRNMDKIINKKVRVNEGFMDHGDRVVWMQSTGLKDKNEKEVFQSDLIRVGGLLYEVKWMEDTGCNELVGIDNTERWIMYTHWKDAEKIGNIFENSNLLPK